MPCTSTRFTSGFCCVTKLADISRGAGDTSAGIRATSALCSVCASSAPGILAGNTSCMTGPFRPMCIRIGILRWLLASADLKASSVDVVPAADGRGLGFLPLFGDGTSLLATDQYLPKSSMEHNISLDIVTSMHSARVTTPSHSAS